MSSIIVENCDAPDHFGDEICDDRNNNEVCGYDGGDCCGPNVDTRFCKRCQCLGGHLTTPSTISTPLATTLYFNHYKTQHEKGHWYGGPTMQYKRKNHAVGVVTDESTLKRLIVVTGGVGEEGTLKSTEILMENSWSKGEIAHHNKSKGLTKEAVLCAQFHGLLSY